MATATAPAPGDLLTVGELEAAVGIPRHRLTYLLRSRQIKEVKRIGTYRLYDPSVVGTLQALDRETASAHRVYA